MALKLVTSAAAEPVTLEEVKSFLRVDSADEDDTIQGLIAAARALLDGPDGCLNRCLVSQVWDLFLDDFPAARWCAGEAIQLPLAPVRSVTSVSYYDADGNAVTLDPTLYYVDTVSTPGWVVPGTSGWPLALQSVNVVAVRFVAGYPPNEASPPDPAANVPPTLRLAIKMLVSHFFENRGPLENPRLVEIPWSVERLIAPFRVYL